MSTENQRHNWKEAVSVYSRPRVLGMLFLGFSAGLPFLLVFTTLTAWLTKPMSARPPSVFSAGLALCIQ